MTTLFAHNALLPDGWADDVSIEIADGTIRRVERQAAPDRHERVGTVIPGFANAHSHAFQRALAGRSEQRSPAGRDTFWTWRQRMYALADSMDADGLRAIARMVYCEMLESGYTAVAEFHYLHRPTPGESGGDAMFEALRGAADDSGIRLCYVPVLYERAGFDASGPDAHQRRFVLGLPDFFGHVERAQALSDRRLCVGIGVHSLRAVSAASLDTVADWSARRGLPLHLHIAEQVREVEDCLGATGRRPVDWLLASADVDERWCLVHATHMDGDEIERLAKSNAVVCICPSTEANLGDGLFPLAEFLGHGGRIAIGSDSHVSINPFEELRWLEYGQRLRTGTRNIATLRYGHAGTELVERVQEGGSQAIGRRSFGIAAGAPADLVVLLADDPMLAGHDGTTRLDALVFGGFRLPIERVMVAGQWCVTDGRHVQRAAAARRYRDALDRLGVAA